MINEATDKGFELAFLIQICGDTTVLELWFLFNCSRYRKTVLKGGIISLYSSFANEMQFCKSLQQCSVNEEQDLHLGTYFSKQGARLCYTNMP